MKLTKTKLNQIIKEELSTLNEEEYDRRRDMGHHRRGTTSGGGGRQAYWQNRASQGRRAQAAKELGAADAIAGDDPRLGQHGAYYTSYDAALNIKPDTHPLDVDGDGELTISEMQLREMIEQISESTHDSELGPHANDFSGFPEPSVPFGPSVEYASIIKDIGADRFGAALVKSVDKMLSQVMGDHVPGATQTYHDALLWYIKDFNNQS